MYWEFWPLTRPQAEELPPGQIHFCFGEDAITKYDTKAIAKKAVLYSQCSYFVTPYPTVSVRLKSGRAKLELQNQRPPARERFPHLLSWEGTIIA